LQNYRQVLICREIGKIGAPVLTFTFIRRVLASFGTQLDAKTTLCRVLDAKIFKVKHERNNSRRNLGRSQA